MKSVRNPDLVVDANRLADWNRPERRRASFRKLHQLHRRGLTLRAEKVLPLQIDFLRQIEETPGLLRLTADPAFCGIAIVRGSRLVFERYAPDFGPHETHSIQSITKTMIHLICGRLIEQGMLNPTARIGDYLPDIGTGYADATVQQALDMDISNNFDEDYAAPYAPPPSPGAPVGYAREEIAMGWRLPPVGVSEFGVRSFAASLTSDDVHYGSGTMRYKSANTDVLGWIAERAGGRTLVDHLADIVDGAGTEGAFHISLDCSLVPVLSGGGVMTSRDLARYGLLLARRGRGIDGRMIGSSGFLTDAMSGTGTLYQPPGERLRYRNHLFATRQWVGHAGYGGQFLIVDPNRQAAALFFSVLETPHGDKKGYLMEIIAMLETVMSAL